MNIKDIYISFIQVAGNAKASASYSGTDEGNIFKNQIRRGEEERSCDLASIVWEVTIG